jgi:hypothetical protein
LADQWRWQDGVIIQKTNGGYIYLFPSTQGRIKGTINPAGVINVGQTITVMYSLKLIGRAKTRFIGMDATRTSGISPELTVAKASKAFGFFVRDTNQSTIEITIEPSFMQKIKNFEETKLHNIIASQGNLNVTLSEKKRKVMIKGVTLD